MCSAESGRLSVAAHGCAPRVAPCRDRASGWGLVGRAAGLCGWLMGHGFAEPHRASLARHPSAWVTVGPVVGDAGGGLVLLTGRWPGPAWLPAVAGLQRSFLLLPTACCPQRAARRRHSFTHLPGHRGAASPHPPAAAHRPVGTSRWQLPLAPTGPTVTLPGQPAQQPPTQPTTKPTAAGNTATTHSRVARQRGPTGGVNTTARSLQTHRWRGHAASAPHPPVGTRHPHRGSGGLHIAPNHQRGVDHSGVGPICCGLPPSPPSDVRGRPAARRVRSRASPTTVGTPPGRVDSG